LKQKSNVLKRSEKQICSQQREREQIRIQGVRTLKGAFQYRMDHGWFTICWKNEREE
jgi:hypothetical protein